MSKYWDAIKQSMKVLACPESWHKLGTYGEEKSVATLIFCSLFHLWFAKKLLLKQLCVHVYFYL